MDNTKRDLMARRDAALAAGDIPAYNALTRQIADLPMKGVPKLTPQGIKKYVAGKKR